ncbi:MAG: hypothetical protein LBU83_02700 [Bacteroidales bacterium]|jgi:hypothetical protein|nr:hypothetical protein [Bacteroidales bacterium]
MDTNTKNIEQDSCSHIIKKQDITNVLISIIIVAVGLLLTCHSIFFNTGDNLKFALIIIGVCFIPVGIFLWILKSKRMIYEKTGSGIKSLKYYFSRDELNFAQNLLENGKFENEKKVTFIDTGNSYFEILMSKDGNFVSVQIFEFSTLAYEPATPKYYYFDNQALKFIEYIQCCRNKV